MTHSFPTRRSSDLETVVPLILDENNRPIGGGDRVEADKRLDLTAAYRLKFGKTADARLFLNVRNVFESDPPFYSGTMGRTHGINRYVSKSYGRTVTRSEVHRLNSSHYRATRMSSSA